MARPTETPPHQQTGVRATWHDTPTQVRALLVGVFVSKLAGFIQIFLVLFLTARGFSSSQAGLALGLYGAGAILGTVTGGSLSDRQSTRTAMLVSMLGSAVLLACIVYLKPYPLLLLAIVLVSAVSQVYRPAAQAMITDLTPPDRLVMVTALYRLALNLGTSVAPLLGVALASVSYDLLFWGEAIAALLYGAIAFFFIPAGRHETAQSVSTPDEASPVMEGRRGYLALLADWRFLAFLFGFLCLHVVYIQYTAALPLAIKGAGLSTWWYGAVIALNGVLVVTCEVWTTRYVQAWSMRLSQGTGYVLLAVAYAVYALGITPLLLVLGTVLWTLSEIFGAPTVWAYPGMVAPPHLRGRYFGGLHSTYGLGSTIGPIVGIALFGRMGQHFFWVATAVAVTAVIVGQIGIRTPPGAQAVVDPELPDTGTELLLPIPE